MSSEHTNILIAGGGIAGMMAAAALGSEGFQVLCVDPAPPITAEQEDGSDLRSTAFLMPSVELMKRAGFWDRLAGFGAPMATMRLADRGGPDGEVRTVRDFEARELDQEFFGYNFPNWLLRREMLAHLEGLETVEFRTGVSVRNVLLRTSEARVSLSDGTTVSAKLLIGADGRNSYVREAAGIGASTRRYGQKAIVFAVSHPEPHGDISTEVHRSGGPFTLVPLLDAEDGTHRSAVVWMERGPEVDRLSKLDPVAFSAEATERSGGVLGELKLITDRRTWPIITQSADALTARRTALIAEAAHVMPPIGAQGLNLSLRDVARLRDLIVAARDSGEDIGADSLLDRYSQARRNDVDIRLMGVDVLNRAAMTDVQGLMDLRRQGLEALHGIAPIRKTAMRMGLGAN